MGCQKYISSKAGVAQLPACRAIQIHDPSSTVVYAGILYFSYREVSRALFIIFVISSFFLCLLWRVLARIYFRTRPESLAVSRRLLVVGLGPLGQSVGQQIQGALSNQLVLVGFVDDGYDDSNSSASIGRLEELKMIIRDYHVTDIVMALPYSEYHKMSVIVQHLDGLPVGVWVALGFFDLALYRTDIEDFAGIPMLNLRASAIDDYQRLIKRAFDLLLGFFALILTLPLMAVSALLVFLEDGAPVLYHAKRSKARLIRR